VPFVTHNMAKLTNLSCRRWTRATCCIVLYTQVDAQCDKQVTVVSRTKFTTFVTVDVPWQNFSKSRVWDKVPEGSTIVYDKPRATSVP